MTKNIITFFNGSLIRPSTILYCKDKEREFAGLSYYSADLMIYKPSMIYECIKYLLTGKNHIYAIDELMPICFYLTSTIKMLSESNYSDAILARNTLSDIKYTCYTTDTYYFNHYQYNEPWHIGDYETEDNVGEGSYGTVEKIKRKTCGKNYVIKKLEDLESSFVEIASLKQLNNNYIINLCGFDYNNHIHLYLPYYPSDLSKLLKTNQLLPNKKYFKQLMIGLAHCHDNDIIHRDIKTQNIIYDPDSDTLKIIVFGIAAPYASKSASLDPYMAGTLWYKAPETLLGSDQYNYKIDIWAMGIVIAAMLNQGNELFEGDSDIDMLYKIFMILGTPTENTWPGVTSLPDWRIFPQWKQQSFKYFMPSDTKPEDVKLVELCLIMNPNQRSNAKQVLKFIDNKMI